MRWVIAVFVLALYAPDALAQKQARIGSWSVTREQDPFRSGETTIAVLSDGADRLAIRCFSGNLSTILILPTNKRNFEQGDSVTFKYRADQGLIQSGEGEVFSDYNVEIPMGATILRDARSAKQLAFQVTIPGRAVTTLIFRPTQSARALAPIVADCGMATDAARNTPAVPTPRPMTQPSAPPPVAAPQASNAPTTSSAVSDISAEKRAVLRTVANVIVLVTKCDQVESVPAAIAKLLDQNGLGTSDDAESRAIKLAALSARIELGSLKAEDACRTAIFDYGPDGAVQRGLLVFKQS